MRLLPDVSFGHVLFWQVLAWSARQHGFLTLGLWMTPSSHLPWFADVMLSSRQLAGQPTSFLQDYSSSSLVSGPDTPPRREFRRGSLGSHDPIRSSNYPKRGSREVVDMTNLPSSKCRTLQDL